MKEELVEEEAHEGESEGSARIGNEHGRRPSRAGMALGAPRRSTIDHPRIDNDQGTTVDSVGPYLRVLTVRLSLPCCETSALSVGVAAHLRMLARCALLLESRRAKARTRAASPALHITSPQERGRWRLRAPHCIRRSYELLGPTRCPIEDVVRRLSHGPSVEGSYKCRYAFSSCSPVMT